MNPVLIISGPTASGKTSLALSLAAELNGDLISADSRQVYKGLDIVTGKDIPKNFKQISLPCEGEGQGEVSKGFYTNGITRLYGYDLVTPGEDWNAALFQNYARQAITDIVSRGRLPIIVGGTGLYLRSLTDQYTFPPQNLKLRRELESLSLAQLRGELQTLDPVRFAGLNHSDSQNPRRLIRHLEIATHAKSVSPVIPGSHSVIPGLTRNLHSFDILHLNLNASLEELEPKIRARVIARLDADPRAELDYLHSFSLSPSHPAFTSLGYQHLATFYRGKITRGQLIDLWTTAERQYAKRQLTWFSKLKNLTRLDTPIKTSDVVRTIKLWYSQDKYGKK